MMLSNPIESQADIHVEKLLAHDASAAAYKVTQTLKGDKFTKLVKVRYDIRNHYAMRREKDLMRYLNQFPDVFCHFDEIRKVNFSYLQFFHYLGKKTLKDQVKKKGVLLPSEAKSLLKDMVTILEKVHGVGFVHAAIRPENILATAERFYLVNWDQAMPYLSSYETEVISGDQKYAPPERLNGQYSDSGDIYTLGCTLYYALTGKHIYRLNKVENTFDQLYAHAHHSMRKPSSLPIFWRQLIVWMTQKDPQNRPSLDELKQWLNDESVPKSIRQQSIETEKDFPADSLSNLADQHYLYGLFKKAVMFEASGDLESAFNLYENCAFQGYSRAENNIGLMYEKGNPVKQSYVKAMNMYHQALEKGNPLASYNLARLFEDGLGVAANQEQAFKLYKSSALRGNINAQNKLGEMFLYGKGTQQDLVQARFWFGMAAHYGHKLAHNNIRKLLNISLQSA